MIQIYADGALTYDSRLREPGKDYTLLALQTTEGLNKAGTAQIRMPPRHPAYHAYVSYKTVVTLYEDKLLRFRGRALYPLDDTFNRRTIVCEGERGFFRDACIRPYLFQDSPAAIFAAALELYNAEVDEFKRFSLGRVTVTDANDYIRLESSAAEKFSDFFEKLVQRCGGYITFSDDGAGGRAANWLAVIGTECSQAIELGSNLLDFSRSGQSPELATAIIPYGAQLEDGSRVTIASVTEDGADWIQDDDAVALRGRIVATVTWDDVTEPANLLRKARQWLDEKKLAITSLQLTAADLSAQDKRIDTYHVGDRVPVKSLIHDAVGFFQISDRARDWLNPAGGSIFLGKTQSSLTGADVAGDRNSASALDKVKREIIADYKIGINAAVSETTRILSSQIEQTSESILARVSRTEEATEQLQGQYTAVTQRADAVDLSVTQLRKEVGTKAEQAQLSELSEHFRFDADGMTVTNSGTGMGIGVSEQRVVFTGGADPTTVITPNAMGTTNLTVGVRLDVGGFSLIPRTNGNLSLRYTGG